MSPEAPLLEVRDLCAGYGPVKVLHDIALEVRRGELVAIVGANGAGKTTLMHTLSGIHRAASGSIRFEGREIARQRPHRIVAAGICQAPEGRQVFPQLSVNDNLRLGAYSRKDKAACASDLKAVYELFPILAEKAEQSAGTLSGGQQQMLAIGRAMMGAPKMLLLDEPSMGLAPLLVEEIFRTVEMLQREKGVTVLLVEQNARAALGIADRGYVLETGRVVLTAPAAELLQNEAVKRAYLGY